MLGLVSLQPLKWLNQSMNAQNRKIRWLKKQISVTVSTLDFFPVVGFIIAQRARIGSGQNGR